MATRLHIKVSALTGYADGDEVSGLTDAAGVVWEFAGAKPVYKVVSGKPCLRFNGTSQGLKTAASVNLTNTAQINIFLAAKFNNANVGIVFESSTDFNNVAGSVIAYSENSRVTFGMNSGVNSGTVNAKRTTATFNESLKLCHAIFDRTLSAANEIAAKVDTANETLTDIATFDNSGNFGDFPFYVGARGGASLFQAMDLYVLRVEETLTGTETAAIENALGAELGLSYYTPPLTNFEDNFNRADNIGLGADYTPITGAGLTAPNFSIQGNEAFLNQPASTAAVRINFEAENSYSRLKLKTVAGVGASALIARNKTDGAFYFAGIWGNSQYTQIGRRNADGSFTSLIAFPAYTAQNGDEIYLHVTGQLLELFLKRGGILTKIGEYTDNSAQKITGAGRNGILGDFSANKIDDFRASATPFIDLIPPSDVANLSVSQARVVDSDAATDNVAIAGYLTQYSDDGDTNWINHPSAAKQFTDTVPLFAFSGNHTRRFRRKAIDGDGNLSLNWSNIAIYSYFVPFPSVMITAPAHNAILAGTVTISATVANFPNVSGIKFYIDDTQIGTEDTNSPYSATLDTTSLKNGDYTLRAIARDANNNQITTGITIAVFNVFAITDTFIWDRVKRPEYYFASSPDWEAVTRTRTFEDGSSTFNELNDTAPRTWELRYTGLTPEEDRIFEDHFILKRISRSFNFVAKNGQTFADVFYKESVSSHDANRSWINTRTIILIKYP